MILVIAILNALIGLSTTRSRERAFFSPVSCINSLVNTEFLNIRSIELDFCVGIAKKKRLQNIPVVGSSAMTKRNA